MYGTGILKGMGVTIRHLVDSFVDDMRFLGQRDYSDSSMNIRQGTEGLGVFTVQYPDEKLPVPEQFRFIPFLLYENNEVVFGLHTAIRSPGAPSSQIVFLARKEHGKFSYWQVRR